MLQRPPLQSYMLSHIQYVLIAWWGFSASRFPCSTRVHRKFRSLHSVLALPPHFSAAHRQGTSVRELRLAKTWSETALYVRHISLAHSLSNLPGRVLQRLFLGSGSEQPLFSRVACVPLFRQFAVSSPALFCSAACSASLLRASFSPGRGGSESGSTSLVMRCGAARRVCFGGRALEGTRSLLLYGRFALRLCRF